jgi:Icc-related predicted phosphoesterase
MIILALSDQVIEIVYSNNIDRNFPDVDLIVSCGDLPAYYLEFVVSALNVPLIYVPGNHDKDDYHVPGGLSVDGKLVSIAGLRVMGLGGSRRYKPRGKHQYNESEMRIRVWKLILSRYMKRLYTRKGIDLLVTHASPSGVHDATDVAHSGFASFHTLLIHAKPKLMLHGHCHVSRNLECTETAIYGTTVMNVYPYRIIEL